MKVTLHTKHGEGVNEGIDNCSEKERKKKKTDEEKEGMSKSLSNMDNGVIFSLCVFTSNVLTETKFKFEWTFVTTRKSYVN